MPNPYFTNVAPYFPQQDQNLNPVFQNIATQQANQNAALAQQNQLVNQAGQTQQGGMNPMAMAMMLRKKPESLATYTGPSYGTNPNFNNSYFDTMSYD
jgi:hypothetical protein